MLRALLRPTAVISHLVVLMVVIGCVVAGQWQLQRLETVRSENALFASRLEQPSVELRDLVDPRAGDVDEEALQFRRVSATGVYRPDEEVLQRNRLDSGRSGFHVLTPFELADGGVVLVRRGWVPTSMDTPPVRDAAPPAGTVRITGVLERPVSQPAFGAQDPDQGRLDRVFHTDTERLDQQIQGELFAMVLRVDGDAAASGLEEYPVPPGTPELEERNHLSYAMQWHIFALLAAGTYGAWWFTRLRRGPTPRTDGQAPPHTEGSRSRDPWSREEDPGDHRSGERESRDRHGTHDQQPLA